MSNIYPKISSFLAVILCLIFVSGFAQNGPIMFNLPDKAGRLEVALSNGDNTIELCGLLPGYKYGFQLSGLPENCLDEISVSGDGLSKVGFSTPFDFRAGVECVTIKLNLSCDYLQKEKHAWVSAYCLDCKREPTASRYSISPNSDADYLIREVFIGGGCFDVSGVSVIGDANGLGEFSDGGPLGIESGVLLATGNVSNSNGPNNQGGAGNSFGQPGDPDLQLMAGQATFDATGIEFDFSPTINQISFNYVFASEEYPEYVCAIFNDVFGFFIDGPGIAGGFSNNAENIAWIPGTTIPVGINSVNPGVAGAFGNPANCSGKGSLGYSQYYVDNTGGPELQYDGWTTVFTAVANVQICESYHIKLVIADAGDGIFDSGVFLEANSFNAGGIGEVSFNSPITNSNLVYEGCNDGIITICKGNPNDIDLDVELNFTIDPSSTATPGVDYDPLPSSFFIPAGEMCIEYQLNVYNDLITEGVETINLLLELPCSCENPFVEILISDVPPLAVELEDFVICEEDQVTLDPIVSGGIPAFNFLWDNGDNGNSITVAPLVTTSYTVTVTDECGQEVEALANVEVLPKPTATIEVDGYLCANDPNASVTVTVTFSPDTSGPWNFSYSIDGEYPPPVMGVTQNPYTFQVNQPGFIYLIDASSQFCDGFVEGDGLIEEVVVETFYDIQPVSCQGIDDGSIQAYGVGINDPYEFFWSNGFGYTDVLDPIGVGTYYVTVTDALGCTKVDSVIISSPSDIELSGIVVSGTECNTETGAVDITVNGGQSPYTYLWSNGNTNQNANNLPAGINTVTVTDSRGCETYESFNIIAADAPLAVATPLTPETCSDPFGGSASLDISEGAPPYAVEWSYNGITDVNPSGLPGGTYFVTVTDIAGCTVVASVDIAFDTLAPVANAGSPDTYPCGLNSLTLDGSGSDQGSQYSYLWQTTTGTILSGASTLSPSIGQPGNYTLVVTNNDNGCTASSSVLVSPDDAAPTIEIEAPPVITCAITSVQIDALGSSSGSNYVVTWTTTNGNIISGANTLNPTVGSPGIYILTIQNTDNNCISVEEIEVEANQVLPTVDIETPPLLTCASPSINLDGSGSQSGPGINYSWSTTNGNITSGLTTVSPVVNQPGQYTLTVTNTLTGCSSQEVITVDEDKVLPTAIAAPLGVITCTNQTIELTAQGSTTGGNMVYTWSTILGNITGNPNGFTTEVDRASTYLLTVLNTDNGCQSVQTVQVFIDTVPPIAFAGPPAAVNCGSPETTLDGTNSSNMPFFSYQWTTTNGNIVSGAQTLTPVVNQGGTYSLIVTDDLNGCTASSFVIVDGDFDIPEVVIQDPPELTCIVDEIELDGSASDFSSSVDFQWTTVGGNILSGGNTVNPLINAPGQYTLSSIDNNNGCTSSMSVVVTESKVFPVADAGKPKEMFCLGDSVVLDGSNSSTGTFFTHDWYLQLGGPASFLNEQTPSTDVEGTYFLVVTDTRNGCTSVDEVVITADFLRSAQIQLTDPVCFEDPGTLQIFDVEGGLYPYQYSVNGGQSFQYNPRFRNLLSGAYTIVVRDARGCEISEPFEIPVVNQLLVYIEPEITIRLGEQIELEAQLNINPGQVGSINWYPAYGLNRTDSLIVTANPFITTPYFVSVIDTFGCEGVTEFKIVVQDPNIFVPTAFSPYNNDGNNDKLMIFTGDLGVAEIELFEVFTRWGEQVFHASNFQPNDENYGWDGLHLNQQMNPAVFVWYANVRLIDGRIISIKGDTTLID